MSHIEDALPEYVLGILSADEQARVAEHLAGCVACAAEEVAYREATSVIAAAAPAHKPPGFLRARLLASAAARGRFAAFTGALAKFFDLPAARARALLDMIDEPAAWEPDPAGISLIHLSGGPRYAAADAGLVRFPASLAWGLHRHLGDEHHLILQGALRVDQTGQVFRAGDSLISAPGSEHSFVILPEEDCVAAVILTAGIEMPPGHPVSFT